METAELHARLMEDALRYNPAEQTRSLLAPYRDVLLLWRAKFMSYEQIAAALTRNGLKVSAAGVGHFCRRTFTKAEIVRERSRLHPAASTPRLPGLAAVARPELPHAPPGRRGPKVARDNY